MADNVAITPGTGATIATDQVGTEHYQKIKLADGAADSAVMVSVDVGAKANALRVAPASDITADTYIGKVSVDHTTPGTTDAVVATGNIAADTADAGNPVKIGGRAVPIDGTAPGTAVVENDRTDMLTDQYGRVLTEQAHPNGWSATAAYTSAQTNVELKAAPGEGLSLYITDIIISNGATAGNVMLVEDTAGTPVTRLSKIYLAINALVSIRLVNPIKLTANKNLGVTSVTSTTHTVTVCGYIAP